MNCCICKKYPKFTCNCISTSVFICNEHLDSHLSGPGNHVFRILKNTDLFLMMLEDLKIIRAQTIANSYQKINQILEQTKKSVNEINNCINNLNNLQTNMLKKVCKLKSLKFVDFEDFENKYFFRVLEEEDGIYKGIVRYGQDDAIIKEGKGNKDYKDGRFFKGR